MLAPERLKPYLLHPDKHVRKAVAGYFGDSWSRDIEVLPLIVQACERFGPEDNSWGLVCSSHLAVTEDSFDRVLELLARVTQKNLIGHLNRVILRAPVELLISREQALRDNPHCHREQKGLLRQRREWTGWTGERLWEELQDFSRRSEDKKYVGEIDHDYADALVEALARRDVPDTETLCRLLRDNEVERQWLEIFLIDLAGARRVPEAIPALVEKFHVDTDYMLERCMQALARIGEPEAVRRIRAAYPAASDNFRNFTSGVLGKIKHPESEEAILALLEVEEDPTYRTSLCMGLCDLFCERAVEVVLREIEAGYDTFFARLEDELLPVADVLGVQLPEGEAWRKEREEQDREVARRTKGLEKLFGDGINPFALKQDSEKVRPPAPPLPPPLPPGQRLVPFQKTKQRVGRNDPCPCGSGKKFKHCCAKKT